MIELDRDQTIELVEAIATIANHAEIHNVRCVSHALGMIVAGLVLAIDDDDDRSMLAEHVLTFAARNEDEQREHFDR